MIGADDGVVCSLRLRLCDLGGLDGYLGFLLGERSCLLGSWRGGLLWRSGFLGGRCSRCSSSSGLLGRLWSSRGGLCGRLGSLGLGSSSGLGHLGLLGGRWLDDSSDSNWGSDGNWWRSGRSGNWHSCNDWSRGGDYGSGGFGRIGLLDNNLFDVLLWLLSSSSSSGDGGLRLVGELNFRCDRFGLLRNSSGGSGLCGLGSFGFLDCRCGDLLGLGSGGGLLGLLLLLVLDGVAELERARGAGARRLLELTVLDAVLERQLDVMRGRLGVHRVVGAYVLEDGLARRARLLVELLERVGDHLDECGLGGTCGSSSSSGDSRCSWSGGRLGCFGLGYLGWFGSSWLGSLCRLRSFWLGRLSRCSWCRVGSRCWCGGRSDWCGSSDWRDGLSGGWCGLLRHCCLCVCVV